IRFREPVQMSIEADRAAVADGARSEPGNGAAKYAAADGRAAGRAFQVQFDHRSREQPVAGLDQRTTGGDVDHGRLVPRTNAGRNDAVIVDAIAACRFTPIVRGVIHNGFHLRERGLNFRARVLPLSPKIRMTYCAPLRPRMYKLPVDEEPAGVNVTMLLTPRCTGSSPGGGPPASTGGSPGRTPKSTPANRSRRRSGGRTAVSTPRAMSAARTPLPLPSTYSPYEYPSSVAANLMPTGADRTTASIRARCSRADTYRVAPIARESSTF